MSEPKVIKILEKEGGEWIDFVPQKRPPDYEGNKVHAVMFEDGRVWDAYGGWRKSRYSPDGEPDRMKKTNP